MKILFKLSLIFFVAFIFTGCCHEDDLPIKTEKHFLVDKIYNYNNQLLAEYIYDNQNRLIKRITTDPVNNGDSEHIFEYENNEVKKIKFFDKNFPQFNHEIIVYYNSLGQIIRDETYMNNSIVGHNNYAYSNGKISYLYKDSGQQNYYLDFKNTQNCMQRKMMIYNQFTGQLEEQYNNFLYDNHKKPPFNIDKIFQIEILPQFGGEAKLEKSISVNNMTKYNESGTTWLYQYNENGYPSNIETKWNEIDTLEPMLLRIKYKEIN